MDKNVIYVCSDCTDERKREAQAQLPRLLEQIKSAKEAAFVKAAFQEGEMVEHMWVKIESIDEKAQVFHGYLDNEPVHLTLIKHKDKVDVPFTEVEQVIAV